MWPIIWVYQSHGKLTVGDMNWHWHISVFIIFALSFAVVNHAGLPLTDTCRPGTAGRWGCLPTHLSGSFSPRIGPCCPVEDRRCCGSTRCLGASAAHAHEQRWPAGAHMTDSFNKSFFCFIIYLEKKKGWHHQDWEEWNKLITAKSLQMLTRQAKGYCACIKPCGLMLMQ